ncbi:LolA family protein [Ketogulonicigenium vulgare]|uniref:Twin-arginine translocation pathway signal n=1 Tax=Ketogulonicigenium vulgare (strain WSH-001) TaxID=759362 RepID=F9Y6K0_KETVW|nr:outer membrane lipoprotein carrier protein LolA [Ketogulonicigenium vulgare]AEM42120.1 Twin-arginine translocation pathway signal [Ketogulonicigenium vulgare WSH-001]ALJ79746.1 cell envelope biogenesis protein LolA [Ketogulonicigenium vulgare]ANW32668.1 cell envelope biogenesis protein LolA [Ketogulonicigenium vulgare]
MRLNRRDLLASAMALSAGTLGGALPAFAQQVTLNDISAYLNGLTTAEGRFTQANADGSQSAGAIYIKRPGRMRFEYDPPDNGRMLASGGQLAIFDPRSNLPPDRYPLNQTPLNIILERNVDLGRRNMVRGMQVDGNRAIVTAQDPSHPEYGAIELVFQISPMTLWQWTVIDQAGGRTTTTLSEIRIGGQISDSIFNIESEMRRAG